MQASDSVSVAEREALRAIAASVAAGAAALVMEGFRKGVSSSAKAHAELVTEYDIRSEEFVRTALRRLAPGMAIVGEEQGGVAATDLTWFVDPIDGTINFIAGHPYFAVSIGLMLGDEPQVGAVVAPAMGLWWSGAVGGGVYRNDQACAVSAVSQLSDAVIGTGFPSRRRAQTQEVRTSEFLRVLNQVRDVRRAGSSAIDLCLVADGTTEAYWMRRLPYWDTSAGAAIVLAAGGSWEVLPSGAGLVDTDSQDVATNGRIREEFIRTLRE